MQTESLKREIGAGGIALSTVNLMVGTGIFVLPVLIAEGLGATALLAYFVCGGLVFCIALCYAELGSKTMISGGPYTYIEEAFGPYAGFLASNLYLIGALTSDAALANAFSDTLRPFIPALRTDVYRFIFQFMIFGGLAWLNVSSVKNGMRFVVMAGIGKLIPLILLAAISMPYIQTSNLEWTITPTVDNIGSASLLLFFAFLGVEVSTSNGGEIKNPARNVPLGLFAGLALVLVLYISVQITSQGVLGTELTNNKSAPLAALANITMGKTGMIFIIIVTLLSILGSLSGEILSMPRIMFATARDGLMPALLARVHPKYATPHISIFVYAGIGFILAVSGGFQRLAIIASASLILIYLASAIALMPLRKIQPMGAIKTFRVPGGYTIPLITSGGCIWLVSNSTKAEAIGLLIFIVIFSIIYFVMQILKKRKLLKKLQQSTHTVTLILLATLPACAQSKFSEALPKDELSVQQTVILAFTALSDRDSNALKLQCAPDVKFYEYGKTWTLDSMINLAIVKTVAPDFKRTNKIDFINTTIKGDIAWVTYNLYSDFRSNGKKRSVHWLETQVLIKKRKKWKIRVLHSTPVQ